MMTDNRSQSGKASAETHHGDVSASEIERFIGGVDFPVDKDHLVERAQQNGAPSEVIELMGRFPDQEYRSVTDVAQAIANAK